MKRVVWISLGLVACVLVVGGILFAYRAVMGFVQQSGLPDIVTELAPVQQALLKTGQVEEANVFVSLAKKKDAAEFERQLRVSAVLGSGVPAGSQTATGLAGVVLSTYSRIPEINTIVIQLESRTWYGPIKFSTGTNYSNSPESWRQALPASQR